ncbi:hypothetical protein FQN57_002898 [Myotisia sp. PD_48]|nr:hypothetical protein FQN57_002898 [Myotisia sp. PD_48]
MDDVVVNLDAMEQEPAKFHCEYPGCRRSYLRSEHLNRHVLIPDKNGAFICYLCKRRFTRNDLLNAHLRRHEKRGHGMSDSQDLKSLSPELGPPANPIPTPTLIIPAPANPVPVPVVSPLLSPLAPHTTGNHSPTRPKTPPTTGEWHVDGRFQNPGVANLLAPLDPTQITNDNSANSYISHLPSSTGISLPLPLTSQTFFPPAVQYDDYPWLFQGNSLFDLPSEDYLNLHFGDTTDQSPSSVITLPPVDSLTSPEVPPQLSRTDHERLLQQCPQLNSTPLIDPVQAYSLLQLALDYCDMYMPLFHRPTFNVSSCSSHLLLALCSLGAFISSGAELYKAGEMLHKHLWKSTVELRILVEHICTYTMTRHEHEMSEIVHGIIVTLARRNNLMTERFSWQCGPRQSLDMKWREWARRESVIRIAHTIFVNDVQYMVYFSHHALLSVRMMKLPLPSHPSLWDAQTASAWEEQMRHFKRPNRSRYFSLESAVKSILSMKDADHRREFLQCFNNPNPLTLHILIHGIVSAIGDANYRSTSTLSSSMTRDLIISDFDQALSCWRNYYEQLSESDRQCKLSWCTLVMYHLSTVLLRNSLSDIQMAAGSAFSSGRRVTPQGAQAAYARLVSTHPISHDSYLHALEIVSLCLEEVDIDDVHCDERKELILSAQPRPLWQTYGAFLGLLVLWARTLGLEKKDIDAPKPTVPLRQFTPALICHAAANILTHMHDRQQAVSATEGELRVLKKEMCQLISLVYDRLAATSWEICMCSTFCIILVG